VNSNLFRPFSACAQHARTRFALGYLIWPIGMAVLLALAFPNTSLGISLASLSGTVYVDTDGDGAIKNGDWGVRGALIQLLDGQGQVVHETYTDSRGRYSFTGLQPGTYTVRDTMPSLAGDAAETGLILDANNQQLVTADLGSPNSALLEIQDIVLQDGYKAGSYNFSSEQYPLQLYSKYMLVAEDGFYVQPAIVTPIPEPTSMVQILTIVIGGGWMFRRRRP
jgi:hypothetical protein